MVESVFRPTYEDTDDGWIESDVDPQLILHIPFTGSVKLKSIVLKTQMDETSPKQLHAYLNMPGLDFTAIETKKPVQTWELVQPCDQKDGPIEYSTRAAKFFNVNHLTLFIPTNFGGTVTRLTYVGLKGEFSHTRAAPIVTSYELMPNVADHKSEAEWSQSSSKLSF